MRNQTHTTTTAGSNACVVACGAAAAKDHLFKGSQEQPGLVTIAMEQILYLAASIGGAVRVSSYQVMQDTHVYDLLEPKEQEVLVLEDDQGKTHLKGLSKVHVKTIEDFTRLGCFDENQDKQQPTKPFSTQPQPTKASSTQLPTRGHQGLIIHISSSDQDGKERDVAKINFLSLSDYVESEVTRILQDSLCKTSGAVVIACLEEVSCQDVVSTLSLAARSSQVATQVANEQESVPVPPPKRGRGRPRRKEPFPPLEPEGETQAAGCDGNSDSCDGRDCGWIDSDRCNCGVIVGNDCNCGRPNIKCCNLREKDACHCDAYLLLKTNDTRKKPLTDKQIKKVEEKVREIRSKLPVFVKLMKQPDIQKGDLNFCKMYADKCLWLEQKRQENRALLVLEGTTMQWCTKLTFQKYYKHKQETWHIRLKAWKKVVSQACIKAQDLCLFELVGRCSKGVTMKVHVIPDTEMPPLLEESTSAEASEHHVEETHSARSGAEAVTPCAEETRSSPAVGYVGKPRAVPSGGSLSEPRGSDSGSHSQAKVKRSLCPSTSECRGPLEKKKKKMHAPDSTHAPPAGPEGSEETALSSKVETGHTVTEEDHVTSPRLHEDLPAPAGRNGEEVPSAKDDVIMWEVGQSHGGENSGGWCGQADHTEGGEDNYGDGGGDEPRDVNPADLRLINQLQLDLEKAQAELRTTKKELADAREKIVKVEEELMKKMAEWANKMKVMLDEPTEYVKQCLDLSK